MGYFKDFNIHNKILTKFQFAHQNDRLAHAYLFYGPEGTGKEAVSLEIAKLLICKDIDTHPCNACPACLKINKLSHPDLHFIFPVANKWNNEDIKKRIEEKANNPFAAIDQSGTTNISINRIRELKNEAKYPPFESNHKVYILADAEKMNRESANSFLKLLEEPPSYLTLILITSSKNALLDTIRSRCRAIYFPLLSEDEIITIVKKFHPIDERTKKVIRFARANLKTVFRTFEEDFSERQEIVLTFLRAAASGSAQKISDSIDNIYRRRDKNYLMEILNLITLWFQDVIHLLTFQEEAQIINIEYTEELTKFTNAFADSDFDYIIRIIEETIQNVNRNVHAPLLLTVLALRIKKSLIKTRK